jgi:N-glycosylase/DNA lyase
MAEEHKTNDVTYRVTPSFEGYDRYQQGVDSCERQIKEILSHDESRIEDYWTLKWKFYDARDAYDVAKEYKRYFGVAERETMSGLKERLKKAKRKVAVMNNLRIERTWVSQGGRFTEALRGFLAGGRAT